MVCAGSDTRGGRPYRLFAAGLLFSAGCVAIQPDQLPRTNLITGSTGGSWYSIGSAIAERTNLTFASHPITAVPGAGGISNPARVARMPGDLSMSFLPFLRAAYRGDPPYQRPHDRLRHVATLVDNKLHVLVADRLGLASLRDIRTRQLAVKFGTGPPGSGEEFLLRQLLAFYEMTYDDVRRWGGRIDLLGTSERADAWRDYHVDVIVFMLNEPAAIISELLVARASQLWSVPPEAGGSVNERWGTTAARIASNIYPNQAQPLDTVALSAVIFGTDDVSDEIAYSVARTIAENQRYLETVHPAFQDWQPTDMIASGGVPYHRGAERYFRERGWIGR